VLARVIITRPVIGMDGLKDIFVPNVDNLVCSVLNYAGFDLKPLIFFAVLFLSG